MAVACLWTNISCRAGEFLLREGEINKNPSEIMVVRYGGMKKALKFNSKLYIFISTGCVQIWPRKSPIGGRPGTIKYTIRCLAPNGAKHLAEELLEKSDDKSKPKYALLAEFVQAEMQASLDFLTGVTKQH